MFQNGFFRLYKEHGKMDRNGKEKNLLYEWAEKNSSAYRFSEIEKEKKSYFIKRQETPYIREYGFETLPELFEEMDCMWKDEKCIEQIKKAIGIAALKNRPSEEVHKQMEKKHTDGKKDMLSEFIYNF